MYIAPGQGQTTPGDKFFMSTETSCHFGHLLQVSNKISLKSDFIHFFFHDFIHVHSPGAEADNPLGRNFNVNRNILSLRSFVASFNKISSKSDFTYLYSPGAGQTAPRVQKFYVNRKALSLYPFVASFKEISFKSDLIYVFFFFRI